MDPEEAGTQQYEEAIKSLKEVRVAGGVEPVDEDARLRRANWGGLVKVKRRAEADGEAIEEQVLPYEVPPVLEVRSYVPGLQSTTFWPLEIPLNERRKAAYEMLTQRGQGAGGFDPDEPVPSLWYADIKALREGMYERIEEYADHYERWVLKGVRAVIARYRQVYNRKHGRMPPLPQQARVNKVYRMILEGRPWNEVEKYASYLLPEKRIERIRKCVRPDHFDEEKRSMMDYQCRDGLLREVRPTLLQLKAAEMALSSIATQRPIRDLPNHDESPFKGRPKSLEYARAIVKAFDMEVKGMANPQPEHLNRAIEGLGKDFKKVRQRMVDTMDVRAGQDYEKGDVAGYVEAVRVLLHHHEVNAGQS
jgi:phosphoglycolate phosphatase-like HAD superfamily hydrolase